MEFDQFDPTTSPPPRHQPSKDHLILQIETDFYVADERGDEEGKIVLEERKRLVEEAEDDEEARKVYFEHVNGPAKAI